MSTVMAADNSVFSWLNKLFMITSGSWNMSYAVWVFLYLQIVFLLSDLCCLGSIESFESGAKHIKRLILPFQTSYQEVDKVNEPNGLPFSFPRI